MRTLALYFPLLPKLPPTLTHHLQADNKAEQWLGRHLALVHAGVFLGHTLYPQQPLVGRLIVLNTEPVVRAILVLVHREDVEVLVSNPGHLYMGEGESESVKEMALEMASKDR